MNSGFNEAVAAILAGEAKPDELWLLLRNESDRNAYALRPLQWEGTGEYQRVSYDDGRDGLVRVPDAGGSLQRAVKLSKSLVRQGSAS